MRDREYAWDLAAFPEALRSAPDLGYACLGGQFWMILTSGALYEPYWLDADSSDRLPDETWTVFALRSCGEVLKAFEARLRNTDFNEEAATFKSIDSPFSLRFNAYFVSEHEWNNLRSPS